MPVHVIVARDELVAEDYMIRLIPAGVECRRYHAAELSWDAVCEQLATQDLFAEAQCFHYMGVSGLKLKKHAAERLDGIISRLAVNITLICTELIDEEFKSREDKKIKSTELQRFIRHGSFADLRSVSDGANATDWLRNRGDKQHGLILSEDQANLLFHKCGENLSIAGAELQKLSLMKPDDQRVKVSDNVLNSVLADNPHAKFYDIADQMLDNSADFLNSLEAWFESSSNETIRLVNEIGRRLLGAKALRDGEQIQPKFLEHRYRKIERALPGNKLGSAITLVAELEHGLKSGGYPGRTKEQSEMMALQLFSARLDAETTG